MAVSLCVSMNGAGLRPAVTPAQTAAGAPALFGVRAGVGFYLLYDEEVQRLHRRSLKPRELHSLMELDGGSWSVVQTKFLELLLLLQKRQTLCLPSCPCAQFPSWACPSRGHTVDLTIPVDQF